MNRSAMGTFMLVADGEYQDGVCEVPTTSAKFMDRLAALARKASSEKVLNLEASGMSAEMVLYLCRLPSKFPFKATKYEVSGFLNRL
mmetsp:Transcript_110224/g.351313  ORF Transcript_110224/g.351313 Transcript_110224/m.351313 type:complete len:87 (-) Transcript_110224:3165-3425(-)